MRKIYLAAVCALCAFSALYGKKSSNPYKDKTYTYDDFFCKLTAGPFVTCPDSKGVTVVFTSDSECVGWVESSKEIKKAFYGSERSNAQSSLLGRKLSGEIHSARVDSGGDKFVYRALVRKLLISEASRGIYGFSNGYIKYPYKRALPVFDKFLNPSKKDTKFAALCGTNGDGDLAAALFKSTKVNDLDFSVYCGNFSKRDSDKKTFESKFLAPATDYVNATPLFFARGGNETTGFLMDNYAKMFPTYTGNTYFSFRQGPALIVVLDAFAFSKTQGYSIYDDYFVDKEAVWLSNLGESSEYKDAPLKIFFVGDPVFSDDASLKNFKQKLLPVVERLKPDLLICGGKEFSVQKMTSPDGAELFDVITLAGGEIAVADANSEGVKLDFLKVGGEKARESVFVKINRGEKEGEK